MLMNSQILEQWLLSFTGPNTCPSHCCSAGLKYMMCYVLGNSHTIWDLQAHCPSIKPSRGYHRGENCVRMAMQAGKGDFMLPKVKKKSRTTMELGLEGQNRSPVNTGVNVAVHRCTGQPSQWDHFLLGQAQFCPLLSFPWEIRCREPAEWMEHAVGGRRLFSCFCWGLGKSLLCVSWAPRHLNHTHYPDSLASNLSLYTMRQESTWIGTFFQLLLQFWCFWKGQGNYSVVQACR